MPEADQDADLLLEYLDNRDVPCPQCGYNLRSLTSSACPECGEQLALRVAMVEPKQAAPIVGLVGLSAGAGMNGLLLVYWLIAVFFKGRGGGGDMYRFLIFNLVGMLVLAGLIAAWLRAWRQIRVSPPKRRWTLAALCCVASVVDVIAFAQVIR